jgi:hypothetical protein
VADPKTILLNLGYDESKLNSSVKAFARAFKQKFDAELKQNPITLPKLDLSAINFKGKLNIPMDKIDIQGKFDLREIDVKNKLHIPASAITIDGKLDLSSIGTKGKVAQSASGTGGTGGGDIPTSDTPEVDSGGSTNVLGFRFGILGFELRILGRELGKLSEGMTNFVITSAKAVEPLQRVKNLVQQMVEAGQLSPGSKNTVFAEVKRIADLPGSSLEAVTTSLTKFLTLGLQVADTLKLIEGISKATGRAGTGERGQELLLTQLQQFSASGKLTQRDVKTIKEQGGADIASIIDSLGGAKGITQKGPDLFFQEFISRLKDIPAPLQTTQDKLNQIFNSLTRIKEDFLDILGPGLDVLVVKMRGWADTVDGIKKSFDNLSPGTKTFIGELIIGLTAAAGALGLILSTAGYLIVSLAAINYSLGAFGVTAGAVGAAFSAAIVPVGIVVGLITAFATNFGNFRDAVMEGLHDIISSVEHLHDSLTKFSQGDSIFSAVFLKVVSTVLGALWDILKGIAATVGQLIGSVLGILSDVVDLIANIIDALSTKNFLGALTKLGDAIATFVTHLVQRILKILITIGTSVINVFGDIAVKLGIISQSTLDDFNSRVKELGDNLTNTNYVVENGALVFKEHAKSIDDDSKAIEQNIDLVKEQKKAYDELAIAAEDASEKMAKAAAKAAVENSEAQITALRDQNKKLIDEFNDSLTHLANNINAQDAVNKLFESLAETLRVNARKIISLEGQITQDSVKEILESLESNDFVKKAQQALAQTTADEAILANQAIADIVTAKSVQGFKKALKDYNTQISALLKEGAITQEVYKELAQLSKFISDQVDVEASKNKAKADKDNQDIESSIAEAKKRAEGRAKQIRNEQAALTEQLQNTNLETQIKNLQDANAQIDVRVANFELTASKARLLRAENDKKIADLTNQQKQAKIQEDISKLAPEDQLGLQQKNAELAALQAQLTPEQSAIDAKAAKDQADANTKATEERLKVAKDSGKAVLDILKPLEDQLFTLFGETLTDGIDKTATKILELADNLDRLGQGIPEVKALTDQLRDLANQKPGAKGPVTILENLVRAPAEADLRKSIHDAIDQIQAIVLSDIKFDKAGLAEYGQQVSPLIATLIGVDPGTGDVTGKTKDDIKKHIEQVIQTVGDVAKTTSAFERAGILDPETLAKLQTALAQASLAQGRAAETSTKATVDALDKIDKAIQNSLGIGLDAKISDAKSRVQVIDTENQKHEIATNLDTKKQLLVQETIFEFQKEDLDIQMKARALAREAQNSDKLKEIFEAEQNARLEAFKKAEEQILTITGGDKSVLKGIKPINVPGPGEQTDPTKTVQVIGQPKGGLFDQIKINAGDLNKLDSFGKKIQAIADAFKNTLAAAGAARQGIQDFVNYISSGSYVLDTYMAMVNGAAFRY